MTSNGVKKVAILGFQVQTKYLKYIPLGVLAIFIWRWLRSLDKEKTFIHEYKQSSNLPVLSDADSRGLADRLYNAMADFGTDEDMIESVYNTIKGNANYIRGVYSSFGKRGYGTFGKPMWGNGTSTDLKGWLYNELSSSDYKLWEQQFSFAGIII